jgi:hypothetical protein
MQLFDCAYVKLMFLGGQFVSYSETIPGRCGDQEMEKP